MPIKRVIKNKPMKLKDPYSIEEAITRWVNAKPEFAISLGNRLKEIQEILVLTMADPKAFKKYREVSEKMEQRFAGNLREICQYAIALCILVEWHDHTLLTLLENSLRHAENQKNQDNP